MPHMYSDVEQLVHVHKKTIETVDGFEVHDRIPLLEQLRDAVFGGMEKTGGSGSKARLPISDAAVDLYTLIDRQITEAWAAWSGRVPGMARAESLLTEWSAGVREDTTVVVTRPEQHNRWNDEKNRMTPTVIHVREEYTPAALVARWVALIDDFLNPEKTVGIKASCIQCGASKVPRTRDGETIMSDALVFRRDRNTEQTLDARCLNCGVVWLPSQLEHLAEAIGISVSEAKERIDT